MRYGSKSTVLARIFCVALAALVSGTAMARTFERCDADGRHCVRVKCDYDGDRCWNESEYSKRDLYRHEGRWVCDRDGDRCHYEYVGHKWHPHWDHDDDR